VPGIDERLVGKDYENCLRGVTERADAQGEGTAEAAGVALIAHQEPARTEPGIGD